MRVDNSLLAGIAASSDAAKTTSKSHKTAGTATSFSSALKSATSTTGSETTSSKAAETTKPVEGHSYADITGGPRSGLYLNTSGNARDGEAFVMVKRNGREYHIYGTGKDRTVIGLKTAAERAAGAAPTTGTTGTTGKTTGTDVTTDSSTTSAGT